MVRYVGRETGPFLLLYTSKGQRPGGMFSTSERSWCLSAVLFGRGFGVGWYYRHHRGADRRFVIQGV